jgi:hypothetical protein
MWERFIGSFRRECFDHLFIVNKRQSHKLAKHYVLYSNRAGSHQAIGQ